MEENVLRSSLARKQLDVIYNKNIYYLIEMYKIVSVVLFYRFNVLLCEFLCRNIKHRFFLLLIFYVHTNGVTQMRFSQTNTAKNQ